MSAGAWFQVLHQSGAPEDAPLTQTPFRIGRQLDCQLVLRDGRVSRVHAQVVEEGGAHWLEDLESRHGTFVDGQRIQRRRLTDGDTIDFGLADGCRLVYHSGAKDRSLLLTRVASSAVGSVASGDGLARLRALGEVARVMETAVSIEDVLAAVVDAAIAVTRTERGFLLLTKGAELDLRVARSAEGRSLPPEQLRVPTRVIRRALDNRRDLLSMDLDPLSSAGVDAGQTVAQLELRSVVAVPLVRMSAGAESSPAAATVGLLYMDSRLSAADLSFGNRELLQALALEASTVLENARLLEEQQRKRRMEAELNFARDIQSRLLPRSLPETGWLRACGYSLPCHQVGGDYYDMRRQDGGTWSVLVADVSGKGVSSALLAGLMQGFFLHGAATGEEMVAMVGRLNAFLCERTAGEKYATLFYATLHAGGRVDYINAGHCPPLVRRARGSVDTLETTSMPVGLLQAAPFAAASITLGQGDQLLAFSDGLSEAEDVQGEFFGVERLEAALAERGECGCAERVEDLVRRLNEFTGGAAQSDDVTLLALDYVG